MKNKINKEDLTNFINNGYSNKFIANYYQCSTSNIRYYIKNKKRLKNKEFSITIEYAWDLFLKQNKKCIYSGLDLKFSNDWQQTASLDRIDSSKGYIIGNVQWVHKDINKMKSDFTELGFLNIIRYIYENKFGN